MAQRDEFERVCRETGRGLTERNEGRDPENIGESSDGSSVFQSRGGCEGDTKGALISDEGKTKREEERNEPSSPREVLSHPTTEARLISTSALWKK